MSFLHGIPACMIPCPRALFMSAEMVRPHGFLWGLCSSEEQIWNRKLLTSPLLIKIRENACLGFTNIRNFRWKNSANSSWKCEIEFGSNQSFTIPFGHLYVKAKHKSFLEVYMLSICLAWLDLQNSYSVSTPSSGMPSSNEISTYGCYFWSSSVLSSQSPIGSH